MQAESAVVHDDLIHFLLARAHVRGAVIRASHIRETACRIHGLPDAEPGSAGELLTQTLIGAMLLLSISKGGMRQVLQLDGDGGPIERALAEARGGAVRGYLTWRSDITTRAPGASSLSLLGHHIRCATVRDLGVGEPYISVTEARSDWLADVLVHYLSQSVQIRADMVLHGDLGLLIEAMPGASDDDWFAALDALARISDERLDGNPENVVQSFDPLGVKILGRQPWIWRCDCKPETLAAALTRMSPETLSALKDDQGRVTLSCAYCGKTHAIRLEG